MVATSITKWSHLADGTTIISPAAVGDAITYQIFLLKIFNLNLILEKKLDEYKSTEKVTWTLQKSQGHKNQKKAGELF